MTIAIAGTTTYQNVNAATSYTLTSYTPETGSNRILIVRVHALRTNETGAFTVDSVTFGGVSLTQAVSADTSSSSRRYRASIWYLINPSGSAGDIVVTLSHQAVGCIIAASTLTGAAQTSPVEYTTSDTTSPNAFLQSDFAVSADSLLVMAVTSHCLNNPAWNWNGNNPAEQYDICTASHVSTEVSGSGATGTKGHFYAEQSQSNPQVAVLAVFQDGPAAQGITPDGIATVEAFGSGALSQFYNITPGGITTTESIGTAVATPGVATVAPSAVASIEGFGTAALTTGGVSVAPDGIATAESIGGGAVAPGVRLITPGGIATAEAHGDASLSVGVATIYPAGIASGESVPILIVYTAGGVVAESVETAEAFGVASLSAGGVSIAPDGITSDENVNGATLTPGAVAITPDSIATAEGIGTPLLSDWRWVTTLGAGSQDALEDSAGLVYLYTTSGNVNAAQPWVAFLFADVPLPAGATVVHTYLRLYTFTYDDPNLTARAQKSNSPAALSATSGDISGRVLTDNGVVWNASNIGLNRYNDSPDLAAVLQEVINLPGWSEGASDVLFVLNDNGAGGHIRFNMADNAIDRPQLVVDYVLGDTAQTITVSGIPSTESLGNPALVPGAAGVVVDNPIATAEVVAAPGLVTIQAVTDAGEIATAFRSVDTGVIEGGPVVTVDEGIGTGETVGETAVSVNVEVAVADGVASAEAIGEATVGIGTITVAPEGIESAEAIGAGELSAWALVLPDGIGSLEVFGEMTLALGTVVVVAGSVASAEAMGELLVTTGELIVLTHSITSPGAVSGPVLSPGAVSVEPESIETAESLGAAAVSSVYGIAPDAIETAESVGAVVVVPGAATIAPDGIWTAESLGGPELTTAAWVLADGIASGESLGSLTVVPGGVVILPGGIATAESIGGGVVAPGPLVLLPPGLASDEAFGAVALEVGAVIVAPASFGGASFGTAWVITRFVPRVNIYRVAKRERGNND